MQWSLNNIFVFQFHCSPKLWPYTSRLDLPKYDAKVLVYNLAYRANVQAHKQDKRIKIQAHYEYRR